MNLAPGKATSVGVYYEGQNASGVPDHYISKEDARLLKDCGEARSINRGIAILLKGVRPLPEARRDSVKSRWAVVGQTAHNALRPGMPRWGLV